jgi:Family of unknown function (DUF6286)
MRAFDRILALVLGLAGLVFGVLVVAEVINAALSRPPLLLPYPQAAAFLREHSWSDGPIVTIAVLLLAAGLLLLIAELKPRNRTHLVLRPLDPQTTTTLSTRSLARVLENAATQTTGVHRATATVRARRARLRLQVPLRDAGEIAAQAERNAASVLSDLQLRRSPRLVVRTIRERS